MEAVATTNNQDNAVVNNELTSLVIFKDGVYYEPAHIESERRRVERDLTLPKVVASLGTSVCNFVEIEERLGKTQLHITYHVSPDIEIPDDLKWESIPARSKGNGGRFYKQIANKRVSWYFKVLVGNIFPYIQSTFQEDIFNNLYVTDITAFAKKVSKFILDHPHKEFGSYSCYYIAFLNMIKYADQKVTNVYLQRIGIAIAGEMKRVASFDDKKLPPKQLYFCIREMKTTPTIQECSSNVHYKISQIDLNSQRANKGLEDIDAEAEREEEEAKLQKQANMNKMSMAFAQFGQGPPQQSIAPNPASYMKPMAIEDKKRKASDEGSLDGHDSKKARIEELNDDNVELKD